MSRPVLIATIVVWTAVVLLFLFFSWRFNRTPPKNSGDKRSAKPDSRRPPKD